MGFDNECILNIQSLAGEYFCPVCRLLVYPKEALQSQCTHLYCRPCLTYVVNTTRACPYDGYLVTEADSKPLIESNKALAETIGKITVHCLYHRSGCSWQGPLSECTTHCSACAFGNSPVVCNRCAVQIVHRQVQEHAQNCPGVPQQAQNAEGTQHSTATGAAAAGSQTQTAAQAGAVTPQAQTSTASSTTGQDPNLQALATTQTQSVVQAAAPTPEQWYQQQQQYQQYYQQYPGYDPYQQHYQQYYPYQQQAIPQYQQPLQVQPQAQPPTQPHSQPQSLPQVQLPVASQPQSQVQVNPLQQTHTAVQPQSQIQPQAYPPPPGNPHSLVQPLLQPHPIQPNSQVQMSQYQQPPLQMQISQPQVQAQALPQLQPQHHTAPPPQSNAQALPQTLSQHPPQPLPQSLTSQPNQPVNPNLQPQTQHPSAHAVTGHHSFPQPQTQQQTMLGTPQHSVYMHPQGGPQFQSQHPVQMQSQFPQQSSLMRPPQLHTIIQNAPQPGLLPSPGNVPNISPAQQPAHAPGLSIHQRPLAQPIQQPLNQQYMPHQQPFSGQQWGPGQNQLQQQVPYTQQQLPYTQQQLPHAHGQLRPQGPPLAIQPLSHILQQTQQSVVLPQSIQPNQGVAARPMAPLHGGPPQPYPASDVGMQVRPMQIVANQQSGNVLRSDKQVQFSSEQQSVAILRPIPERQGDGIIENGAEVESSSQKAFKKDPGEIKTVKSDSDLKLVDDDNKLIGESKDVQEPRVAENREPLNKQVKEEPPEGTNNGKQAELSSTEDKGIKDGPMVKASTVQEAEHLGKQNLKMQVEKNQTPQGSGGPIYGEVQGGGLVQPPHSVPVLDQGKQQAPSIQYGPSAQQRPVVPPLLQALPPGTGHHLQLPGHPPTNYRPSGPGHMPHPGLLNPPPENLQQPFFKQPHGPEISPAGMAGPGPALAFGKGPSQGPSYTDGRQSDLPGQHSSLQSNTMKTSGLDFSSMPVLRDERLRPFPSENLNPLSQDSARRAIERGEFEDLKRFPRPSHVDTEPVPAYGSHFSSSRPLDRGPHGFGLDAAPRPLDKGSRGLKFDSELNMEPLSGTASGRFFPPPHDGTLHANDVRERPIHFHDSTVGRSDSARSRPDFLGPVPGFGPRHRDDLAQRSPGISPHGIGALPGLDDMGARESHRFGDPLSSSFRDSRFPVLPSHLRGGEFEGPGSFNMGEKLRSGDLNTQEGRPNHLLRGEHLGSRNLPSHLRFGEPVGFGAFPGSAPMGEPAGPGGFYHPRFGEPGFRSSFSLRGFPGEVGSYAGDLESLDNSRKRKSSSMGWCRICKIDCETVEGLDLHSQTRDHQKMAMDMVAAIKRNAKKQKLAPNDNPALDDGIKSKNTTSEEHGNKH